MEDIYEDSEENSCMEEEEEPINIKNKLIWNSN